MVLSDLQNRVQGHACQRNTRCGGNLMTSTGRHDKVDEIKDRLDIVDVIGRDISLTNNGGGEYTGATSSTSKSGASLKVCLLYTSDAADEEDSVDLGGR